MVSYNHIKTNKHTVIKYVTFFIVPFLGFILSLFNLKQKSSRIIFYLFALLFSIMFTIPLNETMDASRHRERFENWAHDNTQNFTEKIDSYVAGSGDKDIFTYTLSFIVSRVSTNYHAFFLCVMLIFGTFMIKSFKLLTIQKEFTQSPYIFLASAMFIMWNSIFNIGFVRFYTAAWIAIYCTLQIHIKNNKSYYLLILLPPLIHLSFTFYCFIIFLVWATKKRTTLWMYLYLLSFVFSIFSSSLIGSVLENYLPPMFYSAFNDYLSNEAQERIWGFGVIQETFRLYLEPIYINLLTFLAYVNRKYFVHDESKNLVTHLLILMTCVNFVMTIPDLGTRFLYLAFPLLAFLLVTELKRFSFSKLLYLYPIVHAFTLFVLFRNILKVTNLTDYFTPIFITIFKQLA